MFKGSLFNRHSSSQAGNYVEDYCLEYYGGRCFTRYWYGYIVGLLLLCSFSLINISLLHTQTQCLRGGKYQLLRYSFFPQVSGWELKPVVFANFKRKPQIVEPIPLFLLPISSSTATGLLSEISFLETCFDKMFRLSTYSIIKPCFPEKMSHRK